MLRNSRIKKLLFALLRHFIEMTVKATYLLYNKFLEKKNNNSKERILLKQNGEIIEFIFKN